MTGIILRVERVRGRDAPATAGETPALQKRNGHPNGCPLLNFCQILVCETYALAPTAAGSGAGTDFSSPLAFCC